ncbi:MAG TPA: glycoside hydrolase family 27 protein [Aggregatilineales bacterium]|nr:glycoside hydrolase family 27 protein [Aggregatilineales bacterium]
MRFHHSKAAISLLATAITISLLTSSPILLAAEGTPVPKAPVALTPPMGWDSWYHYRCTITEQIVEDNADAIAGSGLRNVGYQYVILDDCWQGGRDPKGALISDPKRFPHGIKALADFVHGYGLKFGLYSSLGEKTCAGNIGSQDFEQLDANTFAGWGVDYVKYDNCAYTKPGDEIQRRVEAMSRSLHNTGRPIVFSISAGVFQPWQAAAAHLNRTGADIQDNWPVMLNRFDHNATFAKFAHPGFWNDPDVLDMNGAMTATEYRTYFSLWAISAAPLILGNDVVNMAWQNAAIVSNTDVIGVDQDPSGIQGYKVKEQLPGLQVWARPLADHSWAVVLLNRTTSAAPMQVYWKDLSLNKPQAIVRDLWLQTGVGVFQEKYSTSVDAHGVVFIRVY